MSWTAVLVVVLYALYVVAVVFIMSELKVTP